MGWGFKRGILERRRGEIRGDWGIDREREIVWLLLLLRFLGGRRWKVLEVCKPFNPSF